MQDLRDALRAMAGQPLVTGVAVLSLALGIGANAAIFSILDSLLLKTLPVRNPESLIALGSERPGVDAAMGDTVWRAVRDSGVLGDPFVWATDHLTATHRGESLALDAVWASGRFFDVLGVPAVLGRTFGPADDQSSGGPNDPVTVISYGLWQRVFGGSAATLGEALEIDRVRFTIVGDDPAGFLRPGRRPLGGRDVPARNRTAPAPPAGANRYLALAARHRPTEAWRNGRQRPARSYALGVLVDT